jgi:serine/threonine-protein kinase
MGSVYRALDEVLERNVAVKVLTSVGGDETIKRLRLEARITARLVHDHIVRLYDFGIDADTAFFVMEEIDGPSFARRWRFLEPDARAEILAQVAEALDAAHRQGVVHRDVKPGNILLTGADRAKLSDFGLSFLVDHAADEEKAIRGTPHYMSPEQARGGRVDHRSDLYSLGVILYEITTGAPPFQGPIHSILSQHIHAEPDRPGHRVHGLHPDVEALILDLMAKSPEARPASGREAAARLRDLIRADKFGVAVTAEEPPTFGPVTIDLEANAPPPARASNVPAPAPPSSPPDGKIKPAASTAQLMIDDVLAEPIPLDAEQRYLCGHYLAYLIGGSRRRGIWLRRPLDPINDDRARLVLAMAYLTRGGDDEADDRIARAAALLESREDVRPRLSPPVVVKYLLGRSTPRRRKRFRDLRRRLRDASPYAQKHLSDDRDVLNPGLMPQRLDDLRKIAPNRVELDDELVARWNRVAETWADRPEFRDSVLRYATLRAADDPASLSLWPEVVYPLIERALWQRQLRSGVEAAWDAIAGNLGLRDAGVKLDRAVRASIPEPVAAELDLSQGAFAIDEPSLDDAAPPAADPDATRVRALARDASSSYDDIDNGPEPDPDGAVRLVDPDPIRVTMGQLVELWRDALARLQQRPPAPHRPGQPVPAAASGHSLAIGPYRLAVIPSIRSRAAGQIALQGLPNKQIELLVPAFSSGGSASKPIAAFWRHQDGSLVIAYIEHRGRTHYVLWEAAANVQHNLDHPADLLRMLDQLGLEAPDQIDRVLTRRYRPHQ